MGETELHTIPQELGLRSQVRYHVVELIGFYKTNTDSNIVLYLLADGRIIETVHKVLPGEHSLYLYSKEILREEAVAVALSEPSFHWIHSPRNVDIRIKELNQIEFLKRA